MWDCFRWWLIALDDLTCHRCQQTLDGIFTYIVPVQRNVDGSVYDPPLSHRYLRKSMRLLHAD
jgi:hypothetical protein